MTKIKSLSLLLCTLVLFSSSDLFAQRCEGTFKNGLFAASCNVGQVVTDKGCTMKIIGQSRNPNNGNQMGTPQTICEVPVKRIKVKLTAYNLPEILPVDEDATDELLKFAYFDYFGELDCTKKITIDGVRSKSHDIRADTVILSCGKPSENAVKARKFASELAKKAVCR